MSSLIPDLYDAWGPLARENLQMIMGNTGGGQYPPYDKPSTLDVIFPVRCALISNLTGTYMLIEAGTYNVPVNAALVVVVGPTTAGGAVAVPTVVSWVPDLTGNKQYPNRDMVVLGVRDNNGMFSWHISPPKDSVHLVGASGEPGFNNGWTNYDASTWQSVGFFKDKEGNVHIKGLARSPAGWTVGTGSAIFILPVGYRPARQVLFIAPANDVWARVDVKADGWVITPNGPNGTVYWSLDGFEFSSEVV